MLKTQLGIDISIGVAGNRFMAKLASSAAKPPNGDGCYVVRDAMNSQSLLQKTDISKLPGFGGKEAQISRLAEKIADLKGSPVKVERSNFRGVNLHSTSHASRRTRCSKRGLGVFNIVQYSAKYVHSASCIIKSLENDRAQAK